MTYPRYPSAIWQPSPNFNVGRPDGQPSFIVVHVTDGAPNAQHSVDRFCRAVTQAAPHFLIGQLGEVFQLVDIGNRAWHCKGWNDESIGIEHVARTPGELDRQWRGLPDAERAKLMPEGAALDGDDDPGFPLTGVQLAASKALTAWLCDLLGWPRDRQHIRPHCSCPGTTHLDCGRDVADGGIWPWAKYLS